MVGSWQQQKAKYNNICLTVVPIQNPKSKMESLCGVVFYGFGG